VDLDKQKKKPDLKRLNNFPKAGPFFKKADHFLHFQTFALGQQLTLCILTYPVYFNLLPNFLT